MIRPSSLEHALVLVTVSGKDTPGITAELTQILAHGSAVIHDIGQSVIHELLSLSILFELPPQAEGDPQSTLKNLLFKATELGLKLEFQALDQGYQTPARYDSRANHYAVTLIADQISAHALSTVATTLAKYQFNIDEIQRLSEGSFSCIEVRVSSRHPVEQKRLRRELLQISHDQNVDVALQAEGLYRRAKRLIVFDMDSTLIENEVIDEFARELGCIEAVARITREAMNGKMDFEQSLTERCKLLKGLTLEQVDRVYQRLQVTAGTEELLPVLKQLGYKTALISGGFTVVTDRLRARLGIDYAYANQLEFRDGQATGQVLPPIIGAQRKADLLEVIAQREQILLDQVIAVGDGANDVLMLEKAGLGIAFHAKAVVRERADLALSQRNLKNILYLLGISARDLVI